MNSFSDLLSVYLNWFLIIKMTDYEYDFDEEDDDGMEVPL